MIKIPIEKYMNSQKDLVSEHFNCIKDYVIDVIQFYINCCDIVDKMNRCSYIPEHEYQEYNKELKCCDNLSTLKGLMLVLSNEKFEKKDKLTGIKKIEDVFAKDKIKVEFKSNCNDIKQILGKFLDMSSDIYIEKIIKGKPQYLIDAVYKEILNSYGDLKENNKNIFSKNDMESCILKNIFNKIFDYPKFRDDGITNYSNRKWSAYDLCEKLDVKVCPYCNRIYTFTVRKISEKIENNIKREIKDIVRPQLDHYFPQSKYPIFALSFYNLIPSCSICNSSIKGNKDLNLKDNLHPYLDCLDKNYAFDYKLLNSSEFVGGKEGIEVIISSNKTGYKDIKSENNLKFFEIKDIYRMHNDVVSNLVYKRKKYSDSRLEEIEDMFKIEGKKLISKEELFNDIFYEPKKEDIIDTSLGKLYKDIVKKLKQI